MDVKGKNVLVFGAGISGIGAAGLLETHGASVILYDGNQKLKEESLQEKLGKGSKVRVVIGELPRETLDSWIWRF